MKLPSSTNPSRNDGVTILCPVCRRRRFVSSGRKRVCSPACRQALFRRRHEAAGGPLGGPPHRSRRDGTIYQCPSCEARYFGTQRCSDCNVFCQRVGPGGLCPECAEPIAIADLLGGGA